MIEAFNLTKKYGDRQAIDHVSFKVNEGEILGFLGPNGAGKTTTMKILTCLLQPNVGYARIAGYDVRNQSLEVRRNIGYMPENVPLYPEMLVCDYLNFIAEVKGVPRSLRRKKVEIAMEECGIISVRKRLIGNLSKGFQQRVGLAQALVSDPPVLILDEPTVGLDPKQIVEIRLLIQRMAGKKTIILSTHILPEVSMTCTHVAIIHEGKIITSGSLQEVISEFIHDNSIVVQIIGDCNRARNILNQMSNVEVVSCHSNGQNNEWELQIKGSIIKDIRAEVVKGLVTNGINVVEIRHTIPTLEEVFIKVVSGTDLVTARG